MYDGVECIQRYDDVTLLYMYMFCCFKSLASTERTAASLKWSSYFNNVLVLEAQNVSCEQAISTGVRGISHTQVLGPQKYVGLSP